MSRGWSLALGFFGFLVFAAIAWALTTDQIFNSVYDSATMSLKVAIQ